MILVHVNRFRLDIYTIRHALFNIGDSSLNDELLGQNAGETSLAGAILSILRREIQNKRWGFFSASHPKRDSVVQNLIIATFPFNKVLVFNNVKFQITQSFLGGKV